ncbi:MAG: DNA mismatch repair endonuclease MutL [Candidatus Sericytochromatia bacterium]|nr:DNA mismatch repair endonuclease MutL [Candidatus Tanganyikabacteria bacterium]
MAKIHRLSPHLANQIAAGEVIERPSSAAKELVENSLDAGARRIEVEVADGGRALRVSDDGEGMTAEDAALAFERFATSKISDAEDLFRLTTMGFRGEALASIGAVARVELTTRHRGAEAGTRVRVAGGGAPEIGPFGCPEGTTVAIADLFFNTPARLKFMKAPGTEVGHVVEALTALALANPRVAFWCKAGSRVALDTAGARDMAEAAALVLGPEIGPRLLAARSESGGGMVDGLVAPPELIRGDRAKQWLFINGRPIRHPALARAVDEAFSGHIPGSRHPIYAIALTVDPARVDFNVHPTKKEVRLADAASLYSLVREAVARALRQVPPTRRGLAVPVPEPLITAKQALELYRPPAIPGAPASRRPQEVAPEAGPPRPPEARATPGAPASRRSVEAPPDSAEPGRGDFPWDALRLLGQIHDTYLVLEHPEGLYLVDQHNSHERYLYEQLGEKRAAAQELLIPRSLDLSPDAAAALAEHRAALEELGFAAEGAGDAWDLRAVPATLPAEEAAATLLAILEDLVSGGGVPGKDLTDRWRVTVACHSAVKAGDRLAPAAMERLLAQWRTCEQPFTCPHGRPTAVLIGLGELHRRCMRGMQTR